MLEMVHVDKVYPNGYQALSDINLKVQDGEFISIIGLSGAGKSTLLRILAGVDPNFEGSVKLGAGVSIGYFSQDNAETLKGSATILETIEADAPLELIPKVRDMLGAFLFRGDDVFKSLDVLSGGEKSRVALLKLLLKPVNLLILDEPTNHLDMHSKDVLLEALKDFGGTVIFVSHDRGFIEGLSTRVLELKPGHFRTFSGDYSYYMERLEREANGEIENAKGEVSPSLQTQAFSATPSPGGKPPSPQGCHTDSELLRNSTGKVVSDARLSYEEKKKFEAEKRKAEKLVKSIEDEIAKTEEEKSIEENKMANPEVYSNGEKAKAVQARISELSAKLDDLNARWEEAALKLEEF